MKVLINTVDMLNDDLEENIKPKIMTYLICPCCGYFSIHHNKEGRSYLYGSKKSKSFWAETFYEACLIHELWYVQKMKCESCKSIWETDPIKLLDKKGNRVLYERDIEKLRDNIYDQYKHCCTKDEIIEESKNKLLRAYNDFVGLATKLKGEIDEDTLRSYIRNET